MQVSAILIKNEEFEYVNTPRLEVDPAKADTVLAAKNWDINDRKAKADIVLSISPSELKQIYQSAGPARIAGQINCYNNKNNEKQTTGFPFKCGYCGVRGHKFVDCPERKERRTERAENIEVVGFNIAEEFVMKSTSPDDDKNKFWCLDSGCSSHMCNDDKQFEYVNTCNEINLWLANSATTQVDFRGLVELNLNDPTGEQKIFKLTNTLFVSDLKTNLLSVSKITENNFDVLFANDHAEIRDKCGNVKLSAKKVKGLYYIGNN
ncbi:uncharacterized protein LOC122850870 [Aphidius gifuensis]|uniref:uncharacterized protein LOC122850870 n=1 Tax=Aphidius gifuensis TaxID=684658 RepID=UPI001CDD714F|nr:uncharacterized protein LOC122850870 [Aphidius gifuensis]